MNWIVIVHKESGSDYCKGCLMNSWSSEFEIKEFDNRDALVSHIAKLQFKNEHLEYREPEYEFFIIEGREVEDGNTLNGEPWPYLTDLIHDASKISLARLALEKEEEERRKVERETSLAEAIEQQERAKLAELTEKYKSFKGDA